jgi:hypothetical protein
MGMFQLECEKDSQASNCRVCYRAA